MRSWIRTEPASFAFVSSPGQPTSSFPSAITASLPNQSATAPGPSSTPAGAFGQ
ncbi:MAG: hypothetical protein R3F34_04275 [Planctomycetota bacterium]